jgi:hypothetical protein
MYFGEAKDNYRIMMSDQNKLCIKLTDKNGKVHGPFPIRPTDKSLIYEFSFGGQVHTCYFFI